MFGIHDNNINISIPKIRNLEKLLVYCNYINKQTK